MSDFLRRFWERWGLGVGGWLERTGVWIFLRKGIKNTKIRGKCRGKAENIKILLFNIMTAIFLSLSVVVAIDGGDKDCLRR